MCQTLYHHRPVIIALLMNRFISHLCIIVHLPFFIYPNSRLYKSFQLSYDVKSTNFKYGIKPFTHYLEMLKIKNGENCFKRHFSFSVKKEKTKT